MKNMKQFLYDLEWYMKEFITKFFEILAVILGSICYILYYGIMIFGDILALWVVHKIFVWLGL